jgi:hypothetical protein
MVTNGIPLASGLGLNSADATAAFPFLILGFFFATHGYLVYRGIAKVPPQRLWGFLDRPNIDLVCAWLGLGLLMFGCGQILSVPPFLPLDIVGQVISWSGAPVFLFGVICYIHLPKFMTPAWARTPEGIAQAAEEFAAAQAAAAAEKAAIAADKAAYLAAKAAKKAAKKGQPVAGEAVPETEQSAAREDGTVSEPDESVDAGQSAS